MELRDYQKEDVQRILSTPTLGIFNEQRTGKTPTAIVGMTQKCQHILVICPNSMVYTWQTEFKRWADIDAQVLTKKPKTVKDVPQVCIVNYEKLAITTGSVTWLQLLIKSKFEGLILDEAHRIKNLRTATHKAVMTLARGIPYRMALTGTPAYNKSADVFAILKFLNPDLFRSKTRFINEWYRTTRIFTPNGMIEKPSSIKEERKQEFVNMLNSMAVMRKRTWGHNTETIDIRLQLTAQQQKYLKELCDYFETRDEDNRVITQGVLDRIVRYRQICNHPSTANLAGESPKLEWIKDYVKDYPENSTIIFSNSRKFLEKLSLDLSCLNKYHRIIAGGTPPARRAEIQQDFQDKNCTILLIQTAAGKEGLTLDAADVTIFCDTYPPLADYLQAKDRMAPSKPDDTRLRTIYRLMMADSYDEELYHLIDDNISATSIINNFIQYVRR